MGEMTKPIALMTTSDNAALFMDRRVAANRLWRARATGAIYLTVRGRMHDAADRPHSRLYYCRDGSKFSTRTYFRAESR